MICPFPKIITDLRKSRGLSQKQVAMDLKISQALLSHYEKGIRECGLDFLLTLSNYYGVSVDTLLGKKKPRSLSAEKEIKSLKKIISEAEDILNKIE